MDDFQKLTIDVIEKKRVYRNLFRDHGHERNIVSAYETVIRNLPYDQEKASAHIANTGWLFLKTKEALDADTPITIDAMPAPAGSDFAVPTMYRLGPEGLTFKQPVQLSMIYDPSQVAGDATTLRLAKLVGNRVGQFARDGQLDTGAHRASGTILGFSDWSVADGWQLIPIDQPIVNQPVAEYADIEIQPGDEIVVDAGGCVQTGGGVLSGRTWKRYVAPGGEAADRLYHGLIFIPAVTPGLVRIGGVLGRPLDVPMVGLPILGNHVILGYEDSAWNYDDNGYNDHDDGNDDQCLDVGPAWVDVYIKHDVNAIRDASNQTGTRAFDLSWRTSDPNGYPLNPRWVGPATWDADPNDDSWGCHRFEWTQSGVDSGDCTMLELGNDSVGFWKDLLPKLCANDLQVRGHINWGEVTIQGQVKFDVIDRPEAPPGVTFEFGLPPISLQNGDDDVNLKLIPDDFHLSPVVQGNRDTGDPEGPHHIQLEFDSDETLDQFGNPDWWARFRQDPAMIDAQDGEAPRGDAIVVGVLGFDTTHGFATEIHPVHAIAIPMPETEEPGGIKLQEYGYFVRNVGDEGECSQEAHFTAFPHNDFFFRFPWRDGMGAVDLLRGDSRSQGGPIPQGLIPLEHVEREPDGTPRAVDVELDGFPSPDQAAFVAGSFTLKWYPCGDTTSDPSSCGACGRQCPFDLPLCVASQCSCSPDLTTDPQNCGRCGNVCSGAAPLCVQGSCGCSGDLMTDWRNCGVCGKVCPGACVAGSCAPPPMYSITDLGILPDAIGVNIVSGVNDVPQAVGQQVIRNASFTRTQGFFWENGTLTLIGDVNVGATYPNRINAHGQVAGYMLTTAQFGFAWQGGVLTQLPGICFAGASCFPTTLRGEAWAIDDSGRIGGSSMVSAQLGFEHHAAIWTAGAGAAIGPNDQNDTISLNQFLVVRGLASDGWACGANFHVRMEGPPDADFDQAFVWDGATMTPLGTLGSAPGPSQCWDMNDAHQIVGDTGSGLTTGTAFIWQNGAMTALPGATSLSTAYAINAHGTVVGYSGGQAVMWWGGQTLMNLIDRIDAGSDWTQLVRATDISDEKGYIVGTGFRSGATGLRGFLLSPK